METIAKQVGPLALSRTGEQLLGQYEQGFCIEEDLISVTVRNYLSSLRHFAAWCEPIWMEGQIEEVIQALTKKLNRTEKKVWRSR